MESRKMREEFEQFRDRRNAQLESEGHKPGSNWHVTQAHYATWQASRSAVVIELPSADEFDVPSFAHDAIVGCWNAIEAAGLKVKS